MGVRAVDTMTASRMGCLLPNGSGLAELYAGSFSRLGNEFHGLLSALFIGLLTLGVENLREMLCDILRRLFGGGRKMPSVS